jgi:hypothetical protein
MADRNARTVFNERHRASSGNNVGCVE